MMSGKGGIGSGAMVIIATPYQTTRLFRTKTGYQTDTLPTPGNPASLTLVDMCLPPQSFLFPVSVPCAFSLLDSTLVFWDLDNLVNK